MTCDELKAAINSEIAQNARIAAIRSRMDAGTADFLDSELYTAITAEITAEQMRRNVLALSDREPAFVGVVRERYTDTFSVFNAVQRILDAVTGIRIRTVQPEFENDRAHKIGHSLNDPTVPESVIERRAYSATENFVRSQHDRCTKANASFRSRAGLDCRITRTGGAKCCDWCASVSGSFTTGNAPDGIWGRHDNCKCSITYETRRGSFQQLSGSGKGWDTVEELPDLPLHVPDGSLTGAGEVHAVSAGQAAETAKKMGLHVLTNENERAIIEEREMANGMRRSCKIPLSDDEKKHLLNEAKEIGIDASVIVFRDGRGSAYSDERDVVFVSSNIFPSNDGSIHPRDLMSERAALAHEYYGHRANRGTSLSEGAWNDEFRASYFAARDCPNLTDEDRYYLILDAIERAHEAGVSITYNNFIRGVLYG